MCYGDQDLDFKKDHRRSMINLIVIDILMIFMFLINHFNIYLISARDAYFLTYATIQKDVLAYGPIEASFDVYDDFPSYKSGKHAFKISHAACIRHDFFFLIFFTITQDML